MRTVESKQDEAGMVENSNIPEVKKKKPAKGQETGIKDSKDEVSRKQREKIFSRRCVFAGISTELKFSGKKQNQRQTNIERCFIILIITEAQIKIIMRYHFLL